MKHMISLLLCLISVGVVSAQGTTDNASRVELNIQYDGNLLSSKNMDKLEQMSAHMTEFYSSLGLNESLDVRLLIFKTQDEGYEYMRTLYPKDKTYQKTASDEYFKGGIAGVYMPSSKTAAILSLEHGMDRGLSVIFHEISHHYTRLLFGKKNPPVWFTEGLAEHFENMRFSKKKGWISDVSDFDKGKLKTMHMIGELEVEDLFDLTHIQFKMKLRNEGDMFYAFSHIVVVVLMNNLDHTTFKELTNRLINRKTDEKVSEIVGGIYPGGLNAYKRALHEFIL